MKIKATGTDHRFRLPGCPAGAARPFKRESAAILAAITLFLFLPQALSADSVHYDWNRDVVTKTNPPVRTVVKVAADMRLDMVRIYHRAPTRPITLTLKSNSGTYTISKFVKTGSFGAKQDLQVFQANSTGIIVEAGSYQVTSSDPATWLYNAGTGNRGFLAIDGTRQRREADELGQLRVGDRMTLDHILFVSDSHRLLPSSQPALTSLYNSLARTKTVKIELRGHVNAPNEKLDMKAAKDLGGLRAKVICDYLVNKGIARTRVSYKGYGNTQMIHPKPKTAAQESANRRVEVVVVAK